jgi:hypothetical protein
MLASLENRRVPIHRTLCERGDDNHSISQDSAAFAGQVQSVTSDFFYENTPKNTSKFACQVPKPPNPLSINNIRVEV